MNKKASYDKFGDFFKIIFSFLWLFFVLFSCSRTVGCDVNVQDKNKNTPLVHALCRFKGGDITVLAYLLTQKNINASTRRHYGSNLLHTGCGNINILPLEIFKSLIETMGCDVNARDEYHNTPLHYALSHFKPDNCCDITVLPYLINQENVNVNIKDQIWKAAQKIQSV